MVALASVSSTLAPRAQTFLGESIRNGASGILDCIQEVSRYIKDPLRYNQNNLVLLYTILISF